MKIVVNAINVRRFCGVILAILLMAGCSSNKQETIYSYSPPTSVDGRACVDECVQSKETCNNQCMVAAPQCLAHEEQDALHHYNQYVERQKTLGQPISRNLHSFYHPERCDHSGCGCESNYEVCHQLCGTRTEIHDPMLATQ